MYCTKTITKIMNIQTVIKETGEELKLLYVFDNSYLLVSSESSLDITPIILNKMLQK